MWGVPQKICESPHVVRILRIEKGNIYVIQSHGGVKIRLSKDDMDTIEDVGRLATEEEVAKAVLNKVTYEEG